MSKLLAPNGKPSNLIAEQYKLVRTPAFKKWFGDWENDPANASKIVDSNGEPKVMYSGSPNKFTIFKTDEIEIDRDDREYKSRFWFIANKGNAEDYSRKSIGNISSIYESFLNIRNPKHDFNLYVEDNEDGSVEFRNREIWVAIATSSNQIKLADGTNTTFDGSNPDIRFAGGGEIDEYAQMLIDIISMNPQLENYQKYKVILKDKFGIDFDSIYKDQEYIDNANINDIKKQDDFFDFGNWLKYAKIISKKRGFIPMDLYDVPSDKYKLTDEIWNKTSKNLNFTVKKIPYIERGTDGGDIARVFADTIYYTDQSDFYYFLHELGHIYDFQNNIKGIIKNPAYSPTNYGTNNSGETFAENFAIYFINPMALKNWNEDVYNALDSQINTKYKNEISRIIPNNNNITFNNGGEVNTGLFSQIWEWFGIKF
jgi:hypothetical protein